MDIASPITSSETASLFMPGQLETLISLLIANYLLMVFVPLPALIINFKFFATLIYFS